MKGLNGLKTFAAAIDEAAKKALAK